MLRFMLCLHVSPFYFFKYILHIFCVFSLKQLKVTLRVFSRSSIHLKNEGIFVMVYKGPFTIGERATYTTLRSEFFNFARALTLVACVSVAASSLLKTVGMHVIQMRPNAIQIITMHRTSISTNVLQSLVNLQGLSTIFNGRKMNRSCLCVCFATIRLLLFSM